MAAGDIVQKGVTVVVGFNSIVIGTATMVGSSKEPFADVHKIKGANASTSTVMITDPGQRVELNCIPLSADQTTFAALKIGDTITVNAIGYRVVSAKPSYVPEEAKWNIVAEKEDSMTYS